MHTGWSVLYDQVSGYPYYWNPTTNEVRWEMPLELEQKQETNSRQTLDGNKFSKVRFMNTLTFERHGYFSFKKLGKDYQFLIKTFQEYMNSSSTLKGNAKPYDEGSKVEVPKLIRKSNSNKLPGKAKSKNKRNEDNEKRLFIGPSLPPECSVSANLEQVMPNNDSR